MLRTALAAAALLLIPSIAAAECGPSLQAAGQRAAQGGGPGSLIDLASMTYERAEAAGTPQACEGGTRALDRLTALGGHAAPEGRRAEAFDAVMNEAAAAVAVVGETTSAALEAPLVQIIDAATEMGLVILVSQGSAPTAAQRLETAQANFAKAAGNLRVAEAEAATGNGPAVAPLAKRQAYLDALKELVTASKARRDFTKTSFDAPSVREAKASQDDDWLSLPEGYRNEWKELERKQQEANLALDKHCDNRYAHWTKAYALNPTGNQDLNRDVIAPCAREHRDIFEDFEEKYYRLKLKWKVATEQDTLDYTRQFETRDRRILEAAGIGPRQGSQEALGTLGAAPTVGRQEHIEPGEPRQRLDLPEYDGPTDRPLTRPEGVNPPVVGAPEGYDHMGGPQRPVSPPLPGYTPPPPRTPRR